MAKKSVNRTKRSNDWGMTALAIGPAIPGAIGFAVGGPIGGVAGVASGIGVEAIGITSYEAFKTFMKSAGKKAKR